MLYIDCRHVVIAMTRTTTASPVRPRQGSFWNAIESGLDTNLLPSCSRLLAPPRLIRKKIGLGRYHIIHNIQSKEPILEAICHRTGFAKKSTPPVIDQNTTRIRSIPIIHVLPSDLRKEGCMIKALEWITQLWIFLIQTNSKIKEDSLSFPSFPITFNGTCDG